MSCTYPRIFGVVEIGGCFHVPSILSRQLFSMFEDAGFSVLKENKQNQSFRRQLIPPIIMAMLVFSAGLQLNLGSDSANSLSSLLVGAGPMGEVL